MKKLLITGASGFLGWHLCQLAKQNWQIYGTYFGSSLDIPSVTALKIDLRDFAALQSIFAQIKPDAVIHLAAQSSPNFCQNHPQESQLINVTTTCNLAGTLC